MNSVEILDKIAIYGSAFIILLLLLATFIFRIRVENKRKRRGKQISMVETPASAESTGTYNPNRSEIPARMLSSSSIETEENRQNEVMKNIELLPPLKRGIVWAEILGRPGGRRRKNS